MFCGNCGTKNEPNAMFCESCGNKLQENINVAPVSNNVPKEKKKINPIILIVIGVVVVLFIIYKIIEGQFSAEKQAEKMLDCFLNGKECAFDYADVEESEFFSKEMFVEATKDNEKVTNIKVKKYVDADLDVVTDKVYLEYSYIDEDGDQEEGRFSVRKTDEKVFFLFDEYELTSTPYEFSKYIETDYSITVPEGAKVTIAGKEVSDKYLEETSYGVDKYTIDTIFENLVYDVKFSMSGFEFEIGGSYSASYYDAKLTDEDELAVKKDLEETIVTMYEGLMTDSSAEELNLSEELTVVYDDLDLTNGLTKFTFDKISDIELSFSDGDVELDFKLSYSYELQYEELFTDEIKTVTNDEEDYVTAMIKLEDGKIKITGFDYLPEYFSKY